MKLLPAAVLLSALAALAAPASAQFDLFKWKLSGGGSGAATVGATSMFVAADYGNALGFWGFTTRTPVDGTVDVRIHIYMTFDGECDASVPAFWHNGSSTTLASCSTWDQSFSFEVAAGDEFGFGLLTLNPSWPGTLTLDEFTFTPASGFGYWTDLGQGLGGALGPAVLAGQGLLHGGMPIELHVSNAAPHQPATLIVGASALNAPFKGGVMVPTPNLILPAGFVGMGTLELAGTWPNNLPAGLQLWMQIWIVDPTAPHGLSATNGVLAATP
jgi:hypothetical protein